MTTLFYAETFMLFYADNETSIGLLLLELYMTLYYESSAEITCSLYKIYLIYML